jgi:hypothetical protein
MTRTSRDPPAHRHASPPRLRRHSTRRGSFGGIHPPPAPAAAEQASSSSSPTARFEICGGGRSGGSGRVSVGPAVHAVACVPWWWWGRGGGWLRGSRLAVCEGEARTSDPGAPRGRGPTVRRGKRQGTDFFFFPVAKPNGMPHRSLMVWGAIMKSLEDLQSSLTINGFLVMDFQLPSCMSNGFSFRYH